MVKLINIIIFTHDVHKMDIKELYTALSRTTKLEYIHLDDSKLNSIYVTRKQPKLVILNTYFNSDYQNGKIYEIGFELNSNHYVGSTCQELNERLSEHCNNPKSVIYKYRNDKPVIKININAPCKDKKTLEKIENAYIYE